MSCVADCPGGTNEFTHPRQLASLTQHGETATPGRGRVSTLALSSASLSRRTLESGSQTTPRGGVESDFVVHADTEYSAGASASAVCIVVKVKVSVGVGVVFKG